MYPSNRAISFDGDWEGFGNKEVKGNGGPVLSFKSGVLTVPQGNEGQEHRGSLTALSLKKQRWCLWGESLHSSSEEPTPTRKKHKDSQRQHPPLTLCLSPSPFSLCDRDQLTITSEVRLVYGLVLL